MNDDNKINAAAKLLKAARQTRKRLPGLPSSYRPVDTEAAYRIQDDLVMQLTADHSSQPIGYKVGCTNTKAQQLLNIDRPFYGRLLADCAYSSPVHLTTDSFFMCIIEPEFAFQLGGDLPPIGVPYNADSVAGAIAAVLPAIEIVDSRYDNWTEVGGLSIIADNGSTGAWVQGDGRANWQDFELASHAVTLTVNDEDLRQGNGASVMGHPLNALIWLANTLCQQDRWLRAGDLVSTGTCCDVYPAALGDRIVADFGLLGKVEVNFISD